MRLVKLLCLLGLMLPVSTALAQSGKIAGQVTDAATGTPLPGVNVVIQGTTQGSTTDVDGYYTILNVRPGTYALRASFIGYTPQVVEDVRVNIDLTATVDFQMQEETVGLDEVVVRAERPVVQRDISASVANLSASEVENLPMTNVVSVIGTIAGNEGGLNIRGAGGDQISFNVDGMNLASGRENEPFTGISFTSVDEIQVQTAGFSAKYGNVRSGLINVVGKEGLRDRYNFDAIVRVQAPQQKNFVGYDIDGNPVDGPRDLDSYFIRPLLDPSIAFSGTSAATWDKYMRESYEPFTGWNDKATKMAQNNDSDPTNDVGPEQMLQAMDEWYLRKSFDIEEPDYEIDATLSGPVPGISRYLGDLRFTASHRRTQEMWVIPQLRDRYELSTWQGKLTSDLAPGMKLNLQGLWNKEKGLNTTEWGGPDMYRGAGPWTVGFSEQFATHWRNPMDINNYFLGAKFTHTLSQKTFYEVQLQRNQTNYNTFVTRERNRETMYTLGNLELNEEPYGWEWRDMYDVLGANQRTGGHWFSARDTSKVYRWFARFDISSQINRFNLLQAGVEYIHSDYDTHDGEIDPAHPHHANPIYTWRRQPAQGAAYVEDKLEFKGLIANVGVRMDYFTAGGEWYDYTAFDKALSAQVGADNLDEALDLTPVDRQFAVSPRVGVAFPITENSKLFFNYGHFRNVLDPISLFTIEKINTGAVDDFGNPNHPMPKTVQYELGYEHNLFDQFLVRVAGYYRDMSNQPRSVRYRSLDGEVNYNVRLPLNYGDRRGFEVTLTKNRGRWIQGFVNYTYMAYKNGNFGFGNIYQNPVQMRTHILTTGEYYQDFRIPEPYARANLVFLVPQDFGPSFGGVTPLADWRISLLGSWRQGRTFTWDGLNLQEVDNTDIEEIRGNVTWKDDWAFDLRLSKNFSTVAGEMQFFMDVTNVFNVRRLETNAFQGSQDDRRYYRSLHLPAEAFEGYPGGSAPYRFVPGNDQPGDFRKPGTKFVPIEIATGSLPGTGEARALYYLVPDGASMGDGTYYQYQGGSWVEADGGFVEEVLDNKQYIDMPNESWKTFMWPRAFNFGLRYSF